MYTNPILTHQLASLILDERRAEAAQAARRGPARTYRSYKGPARATRRALGLALVRLGAWLGDVALDRPAKQPA